MHTPTVSNQQTNGLAKPRTRPSKTDMKIHRYVTIHSFVRCLQYRLRSRGIPFFTVGMRWYLDLGARTRQSQTPKNPAGLGPFDLGNVWWLGRLRSLTYIAAHYFIPQHHRHSKTVVFPPARQGILRSQRSQGPVRSCESCRGRGSC